MTQDADKANHRYRLAAGEGRTNAKYGLGHLLLDTNHEGTQTGAAMWIRRSAEVDHFGGQYLAGVLYFVGHGVEETTRSRRFGAERLRSIVLHPQKFGTP